MMPRNDGNQSNGLHLLVAASGGELGTQHHGTTGLFHEGQNLSAIAGYDTADVLSGPSMQQFLNQPQPYTQSMTDALPSFPTDDFNAQFDFDFYEQNTLGMF